MKRKTNNNCSLSVEKQAEQNQLKKEIDALSSILDCDMLDEFRTAEYSSMRKLNKEKYVLAVHNTKIQEQKGKRSNGKEYIIYASRPNGESRYLKASTYEGLIDKLYAHYAGEEKDVTLAGVFPEATRWKAQRGVCGKTMVEHKRMWDKYIAVDPIASLRVDEIDAFKLTEFYDGLCMKHKLTYKQLQAVRGVMSYVLGYCVKHRLISHNPVTDVDYRDMPYAKTPGRKDKIKKTPFPVGKIPEIIEWCHRELDKPRVNVLYPYGIIIGVELGDRYGELKGLRWSNINWAERTVTVDDQSVPSYSMGDDLTFTYEGYQMAGHIKGYEDPVPIPIPDETYDALTAIRELGIDDEFVFPENYFRHNTFNNYIKRMAGDLGLEPSKYSSHSLRATAATNLYQKTHDIFLVQRVLHHTTPEMTMKYIKDLDMEEKLRAAMLG